MASQVPPLSSTKAPDSARRTQGSHLDNHPANVELGSEFSGNTRFNKKAHIRYSLRHLRMLPPPYETDDTNRITFGFFALGSLALLGALDRLNNEEKNDYIHWVYQQWDERIGGFRGGPSVDLRDLDQDVESLHQPHLTHTYTALLIIALLSVPIDQNSACPSPYKTLDVPKLLTFVKNCQRPNGSFGSFPNSIDQDVRFVYCAAAILSMVNVDPSTVIDVDSTVQFLESCRRYEGGYGQTVFLEAQGGTTYCVLAALALLNRLESSLTDDEVAQTRRWLVDRQMEFIKPDSEEDTDTDDESTTKKRKPDRDLDSRPQLDLSCSTSIESVQPRLDDDRTIAGFQGRIGKPLDACYSFWCTAALRILNRLNDQKIPFEVDGSSTRRNLGRRGERFGDCFDPKANVEFLLECQSKQWGGLARFPDDHPDLYHSYLALASLSLSFQLIGRSRSYTIDQSGHESDQNPLLEHDPLLNVPKIVSDWIKSLFAIDPHT